MAAIHGNMSMSCILVCHSSLNIGRLFWNTYWHVHFSILLITSNCRLNLLMNLI